jgi:multisubunit Na+/H+ antiporter MnhE subunit
MRAQFSFHSYSTAIWLCGLIFSVLAALLKMFFSPQFNPSILWHTFIAFFIATVLWYWLVARSNNVTVIRAGSIGALIGFLTPPLTWLAYGVYLFFTAVKPVEALGWSLAYAWLMLIRVSLLSLLLGTLIGVGMAYVQPERTQSDLPDQR